MTQEIVQDEKFNEEILNNLHPELDNKDADEEGDKEPDNGVDKKNKVNEPKEGSKRWKKVYWEAKENKRKLEELETIVKKKDEDIEILKSTSKELLDLTKKREEDSIEISLADLKEKRKQARAEGDWDKVDIIEEQMDKLKENKNRTEVKSATPQKNNIEQEVLNEVDKFRKEVEWFSPQSSKYNEAMNTFAIGLEQKLLKSWTGSYGDLLKKIKEDTEKNFSYKKTPKRENVNPVEGVDGSGGLSGEDSVNTKISLDAKALRFCELNGISPEVYIKHKQKLMKEKETK